MESGEDYRKELAGHLNNEKGLDKNEVFKILRPYFESYIKGYYEYRKEPLCTGLEMITAWINRQKKNEFNPPHTHDGDLNSFFF